MTSVSFDELSAVEIACSRHGMAFRIFMTVVDSGKEYTIFRRDRVSLEARLP